MPWVRVTVTSRAADWATVRLRGTTASSTEGLTPAGMVTVPVEPLPVMRDAVPSTPPMKLTRL